MEEIYNWNYNFFREMCSNINTVFYVYYCRFKWSLLLENAVISWIVYMKCHTGDLSDWNKLKVTLQRKSRQKERLITLVDASR